MAYRYAPRERQDVSQALCFNWIDAGTTHYETQKYIAWCFRDRFGEEFGLLRSVNLLFNREGQLDPKCSVGSIEDADKEESFSFDVEPKVGEEHEVLGEVYFELVVVYPAPELMEEEAADLMDVEDDLRQ